jgi:hypothetical protein
MNTIHFRDSSGVTHAVPYSDESATTVAELARNLGGDYASRSTRFFSSHNEEIVGNANPVNGTTYTVVRLAKGGSC